jgi:hypothetical protein
MFYDRKVVSQGITTFESLLSEPRLALSRELSIMVRRPVVVKPELYVPMLLKTLKVR